MKFSIEDLLAALPPYRDEWITITGRQSVKDIIVEVLNSHREFAPYYDDIALFFDGDTVEDIANNLYDFLKQNIRYHEEKEENQTTATPSGILTRREGDCKHYSTFAGGILDAINRLTGKNIKWNYRFASYDPFNKNPHHVFIVVNDHGREIWIDPTPGSEINEPLWQIDKKINFSPMALRRNIAGVNIGRAAEDVVYVEDRLPLYPNEEPAPIVVEMLEEQNADDEVTPQLEAAITVLLNWGIMNENGEISDKVLNDLAPKLSPEQFEEVTNARHVLFSELEKSATVGSFFSTLWRGVKKVTLAIPRNAYLSLVAINAFGFATKLHNAVYNPDGTFFQPGQQMLYDRWNKFGGDWHNLRLAIDAGAKKKAILGAAQFNGLAGRKTIGFGPLIAPAAATAAAWYTIAATLIVALTPLIKQILLSKHQAGMLSPDIDPNTGLPRGVNPGQPLPQQGNFLDNIMNWIKDNPIPAAVGAGAIIYLVTQDKKKKGGAA